MIKMFKDMDRKKIFKAYALMVAVLFVVSPNVAFAAKDASSVITGKFNSIFDLFASLASSVGALLMLYAFSEVGISYSANDGMTQAGGLKRVAGAMLMILAPQIVNALK
ncbi:MAG: hypothetical protein K5851_03560 [Lachnospiraceae bacterium]|nr:hypothetical protein [Lachnospiraceae bacterium]